MEANMKRIALTAILAQFIYVLLATAPFSFAADQSVIEAAKKEGAVSVYIAYPRRFLPTMGELFTKMYGLGNDFEVLFSRKGSGAIIQTVEAEQMTGKATWDIVCLGDSSPFLRWIDKEVLMKYEPGNIGNVREEFQDPLGYRVGAQIWITSLALHKKRVPEKDWPRSYQDLLDPKWRGRIGLVDPATGGPGVMTTKFLLDQYGWDFYKKLGKNKPIVAKGGSALEQLLLSGEVDVVLGPNEYSILERIAAGETDLHVIYPKEGVGYGIVWSAINKKAPHPNAAKLWQESLVTDEMQKLITDKMGRYTTSKRVKLAHPRPEGLKLYKLDEQWLKTHKDDMAKRFTQEIQKGRR
jgi:iron(III) transport system substrate-binding protein